MGFPFLAPTKIWWIYQEITTGSVVMVAMMSCHEIERFFEFIIEICTNYSVCEPIFMWMQWILRRLFVCINSKNWVIYKMKNVPNNHLLYTTRHWMHWIVRQHVLCSCNHQIYSLWNPDRCIPGLNNHNL